MAAATTARGIVWARSGDAEHLAMTLALAPHAEWIHTAYAGVDAFAHLLDQRWTWTSGKGALAGPVAEHALSLTLAALRHIPAMARTDSWCEIEPRTLFGANVVVVGAGAVGAALATLLAPFSCSVRLLGHGTLRRALTPASAAATTGGERRAQCRRNPVVAARHHRSPAVQPTGRR
jgi:phosphoglycerate dehydrogenase-like enzyme